MNVTRRAPSVRLLSSLHQSICSGCLDRRRLHSSTSHLPIPSPTPFIPDVPTFLTVIGRGLSKHATQIPNWPSLFTLSSAQLSELGVEPARTRKYLLWWRDRFRRGIFGPGGDLKHVKDGVGELKIVEMQAGSSQPAAIAGLDPTATIPNTKRIVVNIPEELLEDRSNVRDLKAVEGMRIEGARSIKGPFAAPVKGTRGSVATMKVQEGMWEVRRGIKVDGGERRKKQVRRQRLLESRKKSRA
ncbi:uncharacterized protein KY384_009036 [Bacidia gigantensis]|uniref:uncharacterized protein n=1 Tax=Bacidia gigantensis TaxID=2732470 RepID=UPI001D0584B9|nr:uncharacterized protein KY384_009036 [Bacidia gigantensis]KAG8525392.1 hypothetical protein KY384_009036 [Bacidia gigantensis]